MLLDLLSLELQGSTLPSPLPTPGTYVCDVIPASPPPAPDVLSAPTGDQLLEPTLRFLPRGPAWRTDENADADHSSYLHKFWRAVCDPLADVYAKAWTLVLQSTSCTVTEGLADWENDFGLPDACNVGALTLSQRFTTLRAKVSSRPGQSINYFGCLAASLGHQVTITELRASRANLARCGDFRTRVSHTRIAGRCGVAQAGLAMAGENQTIWGTDVDFWWRVAAVSPGVRWFRCGPGSPSDMPADRSGLSECGRDRLGFNGRYPEMECLFQRDKPAHTKVQFRYVSPSVTASSTTIASSSSTPSSST